MPDIKVDAPGYHYKITSTNPIAPDGEAHKAFLDALIRISNTIGPVSLDVMTSGPNFVYDFLGTGTRNYHAVLSPTGRQRQITATSFWTLQEFLHHNPMVEAVFLLLEASATKIEVDWP